MVKRNSRKQKNANKVSLNFASFSQPVNTIYRIRLSVEGILTSSAGGNILTAISLTPSSASEFAQTAALYDEFRLHAVQLSLFTVTPIETSGSSPLNGLCVLAFDFNDSNTPASVSELLPYSNRKMFQIISLDRNPEVYSATFPRAGGNTAILWYSTATTPTLGSIKVASSGLTASRDYVEYVLDYFVEFRGRS